MSLRNVVVPVETYSVNGTIVTLRGLSGSDLTYMAEKYKSRYTDLKGLLDKAKSAGGDFTAMASVLAANLPEILCTIIACGAEDREAEDVVCRLPAPAMIDMVKIVAKLTFDQYGGFKSFFNELITLLTSVNENIPDLEVNSMT